MINKLLAFWKKDIQVESSYKLSFFGEFISMFLVILSFYFISKLVGSAAAPFLGPYGTDYFSFVLIGIAVNSFFLSAVGNITAGIRAAQLMGTLESMMVTPTPFSIILLAPILWRYTFTTINVILYLVAGVFLFGVNFGSMNLLSFLVIFLISMVCFSCLGIISACFILIFKRGNAINWILNDFSSLVSGTYFPIAILPGFLRIFSFFLPLTYTLNATRMALFKGAPLTSLLPEIAALLLFIIILLPIAVLSIKFTLKKAKLDGSLSVY